MNFDDTRAKWDRERPLWPAGIEHAAKRKRLALSLHAPLGDKDPYLKDLNESERIEYLSASAKLKEGCDEVTADQAQEVIWSLRALVVDRIPENSKLKLTTI